MNPEIKKLWVDALRSGEYKQCIEVMHDQDGFTCLGVLCELHRKITGLGKWNKEGDVYDVGQPSFYHNGFPPHLVQRWAGLMQGNPVILGKSLYIINDDGSTFLEIADLIEKHF